MKSLLAIIYLAILALAGWQILEMMPARLAGPSDGTSGLLFFMFVLVLVAGSAISHHFQFDGEK